MSRTTTPTSQKKVSHGDVAKLPYLFSYLAAAFEASPAHGDVAKLPYLFSYLAAAFEASPAQAITNCDKPT